MGQETLFTQINWIIVVGFNFAIALITVTPELYAMVKEPRRWIPINCPPFMIGDDYHYFSMLNNVHRRFLNRLYGIHLCTLSFTASSCFQLFGYLLNIIPYHIGYIFIDRRLGVVFVRIFNRFFLGISVVVFSALLYESLGFAPRTEILLLTYIIFFLFFPGPFGRQISISIAKNLRNRRHIYDAGNANDLTRAMFSETTAPLILFACALLLIQSSDSNQFALVCGELVLVFVLFFLYLPVALVYSWLVCMVQLLNGNVFASVICAFMTFVLIFLYFFSISKDEVGKEIFAHSDGGRYIKFHRSGLFGVGLIILSVLGVCVLVPEMRKASILLIFVSLGSFVFTLFLVKHQASRIWDRAAIIPFQLMSIIGFLTIFINFFDDSIVFSFIVILAAVLYFYYYRQSVFLFHARATLLPSGLEFERDVCPRGYLGSITSRTVTSRTVATNSVVFANCVDLFSDDVSLLRNYSIQSCGFKKHLMTICANFKLLGESYNEFERLLTVNVGYQDWQLDRPFDQAIGIAESCYAHTLQYLSTNREFNAALVDQGMYSVDGWTTQYKTLLRETWDSIDISEFSNVYSMSIVKPF
jgi:hypothetical protein